VRREELVHDRARETKDENDNWMAHQSCPATNKARTAYYFAATTDDAGPWTYELQTTHEGGA